MLVGILSRSLAFITAETAWLNEYPGATLNEIVTTGNWPWWLIVSGDGLVVKLLIAESGTGVACVLEVLDGLEDPLLPLCVLEELWVEDASAELGVEADRPVPVDAVRVLTVPLEAVDVRPDVLCDDESELEVLLPWK
jgi:hypothetical protein